MTIEVEAIQSDASQIDGSDSIADAFLNRMSEDEDTPLSQADGEEDLETASDEADAEPEDEATLSEGDADADSERTEAEAPAAPKKKHTASDDDVFEVEGAEVSFRDLKRDFGRNKALTLKEQQASETKRTAEERIHVAETLVSDLLRKADEDYRRTYLDSNGKPLNFTAMAMENGWDAKTFATVTEQERAAFENLQYLRGSLGSLAQRRQDAMTAEKQRTVEQNSAELLDPVHGIKDFGREKLVTLAHYAHTEFGVPKEYLDTLGVNPQDAKVIKMMNRLYELEQKERAGAKALETKTTKPEGKSPPQVIKSSANNRSVSDPGRGAIERLKTDTSSDAIQNAFLARMRGA